jgi:hypothetical protein
VKIWYIVHATIWNSFRPVSVFFLLVYCTKINLATLVKSPTQTHLHFYVRLFQDRGRREGGEEDERRLVGGQPSRPARPLSGQLRQGQPRQFFLELLE